MAAGWFASLIIALPSLSLSLSLSLLATAVRCTRYISRNRVCKVRSGRVSSLSIFGQRIDDEHVYLWRVGSIVLRSNLLRMEAKAGTINMV